MIKQKSKRNWRRRISKRKMRTFRITGRRIKGKRDREFNKQTKQSEKGNGPIIIYMAFKKYKNSL